MNTTRRLVMHELQIMASEGRVNVGQLLREQQSAIGVVVGGFGLYHVSVVARGEWGNSMRK